MSRWWPWHYRGSQPVAVARKGIPREGPNVLGNGTPGRQLDISHRMTPSIPLPANHLVFVSRSHSGYVAGNRRNGWVRGLVLKPTITSSTSRRTPMGIAGLEGVGCPSGRQRVTRRWIEDSMDFCRKTRAVFDAEVYRNSTGVSDLGKSAGKTTRLPRQACPIILSRPTGCPM
jgi:hypothetical protein